MQKISVFVICVEAIIYLLLYNLHDCTFKRKENKIFQELRISADLAGSAIGYYGIGRRYITYLKTYIKIRVNTMDRDCNRR